MSRLPPRPDLDWTAEGAPRAAAFDDVYFSKRGGLAESEAVFLRGCGLPEAWANRRQFSICELGFGTGLNVLAAWRAWKSTGNPDAILHISTIEAFPLEHTDAAAALAAFPEVSDLAAQLLAQWPVRARAPQRLWFPDDRFALTVHIGDVAETLAGLRGSFDAWFLDGFAPSRNPAMWSEAIFESVAALSAPGARAATFSVAGAVRRGLEAAGFDIARQPGFGDKRERLEARLTRAPVRAEPLYPYRDPQRPPPRRVAIIGAGVAGAASAAALARRGVEAIVLDSAGELGAGASGNPAGLVAPRLDRGETPLRQLFLAAYLEAVRAYEALGADVFTPCGVEEAADEALADLLADPPLPPDWFAACDAGALHPRAGLVRPQAAIRAWLSQATLMCEAEIAALAPAEDGWRLIAPDGKARLRADAVVLACGAALPRFEAAAHLPIELTRGQIEWGGEGVALARARMDGSYVAPLDGGVLFGATFDKALSDAAPEPNAEARARNLSALATLAPEIAARVEASALTSRAALRAATPDRAPIAGLLPDAAAWCTQNAGLAQGCAPDPNLSAPAIDGVYVLGGLGARGLTLAPLLGERLAAEMCGAPQTLSQSALDAIHPARFLHRALKRGR